MHTQYNVLTWSYHSGARWTGTMRDAELDHKVEAWSALTKLVVGAVALVLDKLALLAHLNATNTRANRHTNEFDH